MSNIVVRTATLNDLEVLLAFEQKIIEAEKPFDCTLKDEKFHYYNLEDHILRVDAEVVVAVVNDEVVGSGFARIEIAKPFLKQGKFGHLGFMYVMPEHRGKGVNSLIINALIDWCKQQKLSEIRLEVYNENSSAIKAYEKTGLKPLIMQMRYIG